MARFLWHHALRAADICAGVQAAVAEGPVAAVEVLLGVLQARTGCSRTSAFAAMSTDVQGRALRAGHKGEAMVEALAR